MPLSGYNTRGGPLPPLTSPYDPWQRRGKRIKKIFRQLTGSLCLFLLVLGGVRLPGRPGELVREGVSWALTTTADWQIIRNRGRETVGRVIETLQNYRLRKIPVVKLKGEKGFSFTVLPVDGQVCREYGWVRDGNGWEGFHPGVDLAGKPGTEVKAVKEGKVIRTGQDEEAGWFVLLDHGDGWQTCYSLLQEVMVRQGEEVKEGQVLGRMKGERLHLELRRKNETRNPLEYLERKD
ncbi:MAG: hypothetical protein PWQ31_1403 [Eubacteriales bacterium]|nr:hypothetical protein [Eubacteriales bacterium]